MYLALTSLASLLTVTANASPNIIFIVLDDFGYADLSATGAEYDTPNLDYLYSESIVLNSHYIGLVCSPSRAQMLTGRYAWNFGASAQTPFGPETLNTFPVGFPTIANLLSHYTSYASYVMGKWHLGFAAPDMTPLYRGFSEFYGFLSSGIWYTNKTASYRNNYYIDWRANSEVDYDTQYEYSTYVTRDKVVNTIEKHGSQGENAKDPFYMFVPFQAPHGTLQYVSSPNEVNCDIDDPDQFEMNFGEFGELEELGKSNALSRYQYCLNILAVDEAVGQITTALKNSSLWHNTLIIFTSDNGGSYNVGGCNYPFRGGKMTFFDGGVRVITFVSGGYVPSDQRGTQRDGFIHGADWVPTLLGLIDSDSLKNASKKLNKNEQSSLLAQISQDLQTRVYVPAAKQAALKIDNNTDNFYKYLSNTSFDGIDLSQWLLYGDEADNPHTDMPLSINNITSNMANNVALVFESELLQNTYKFMYLSDTPNERGSGFCSFNKNTKKRRETEAFVNATQLLYDLTINANESVNLMQNISLTGLQEYFDEVGGYERVHASHAHLAPQSRKQAVEMRDFFEKRVEKLVEVKEKEGKKGNVIESLETYAENEDVVLYLWYEAVVISDEYKDNPLFNDYLDCLEDNSFSVANPALHGNAWSSFMSFEDYQSNLTSVCEGQINPPLLELFLNPYDG